MMETLDKNTALITVLEKVLAHLEWQANAVCGNENYNHAETADFFKGYNVVIRENRDAANGLLPEVRAALGSARIGAI